MRFIHISDLHFNPGKDGRTSRKIREDLVTYLQRLNISADELLITGDLRHAKYQRKEQCEVDAVVEYIKEIAKAIKITEVEHIHLVPGNHDRDRNEDKEEIKAKTAEIKGKYNIAEGCFEKNDLEFLLQQFEYFKMVCNTLYGPSNYWSKAELHTYRVLGETVFLYLNTAIMHNVDEDRGHLIIGNDCLDRLLKEIDKQYPNYPIIILAHHSPDLFEKHEKEAIEEILMFYPNVFLYLCGDAHEAWIRKVNWHLEVTMGCLKQGKGVEPTFLYGETESQVFKAHHWVKAWEPFTAANMKLQEIFPPAPIVLDPKEIVDEQKRIENDTLLPWLKNSPSIKAVFPELFVPPNFTSEKRHSDYKTIYDIVNENINSHFILTGEAGSGKTTFLRQLFLYENFSKNYLYLHARALVSSTSELRPYQKFVRSLLLNGIEGDKKYIVLLDGIDEAYFDNEKALNTLINSIDKLKNTKIWFGWRKDHLSRNETDILREMTCDTVSLGPWTEKMADDYTVRYADALKQDNIIISYRSLVKNNRTIKGFTESPFQLSLLVYLLHNKESDPVIDDFFNNSDQTIFALYDVFFYCWLKKERARKTSYLDAQEIREALWEISSQLYYHPSCTIMNNDTAIKDLLTFSILGDGAIANGFFHRSFCAFFLADKAFNAVKIGDISLIETLTTPMRNDVTDFLRSAISGCDTKEIELIQRNLINVYKQVEIPDKGIISSEARCRLEEIDESARFVLKNEIIYLVTRIPDPTGCIPDFLEEINSYNTDPYILLDIAYAAALTGPAHIVLEYASTLEPGSQNELINRSWTVAYFGDVQANPYTYEDKFKVPWSKSREARLNRFQKSNYKAFRFRILDFPLLYCFYSDRDWKDINEADYLIIKEADIDNEIFSQEEKIFLQHKKEQLLQKFEEHLGLSNVAKSTENI
ncbi:MAG: metallophosphoesterase [Acutalibacteraceae bacterium]|jgi:predicted MPP superfamily phosphohydrolase